VFGTIIAQAVLFGAIPVIVGLFATLHPRRAALVSVLGSMLFLPNMGVAITGLPDYTKYTAATAGVFLGILLFDAKRLFAFRPHWVDLPIVIFCVCQFFTSLSNDLGYYDGFCATTAQISHWGGPYLVGRLYLGDREGTRAMALTVVAFGLVYAPLCLWEIRFSPQLHGWLYGVSMWTVEGPRYHLGYRPFVFLITGLEVSMWMAFAALTAYWLWATRAVRSLGGVSMLPLVALLLTVTVLCKSVGAILLLLTGLGTLKAVRWSKSLLPFWVLMALAPAYMVTRLSGEWAGREMVHFATTYIDPERGASLEFRLKNEDILMEKALQRPLLGWGGWNRNRVTNKQGRDISVTDGYWIITMGTLGLIGLVAYTATFLVPSARLARGLPARRWAEPPDAPAVTLAVGMTLYLIDGITNAYASQLFGLALGGFALYPVGRRADAGRAPAERPAAAGEPEAVGDVEGAEPFSGRGLDGGGAATEGHPAPDVLPLATFDETFSSLLAAATSYEQSAAEHPGDPAPLEGLGDTYEQLARLMKACHQYGESLAYWRETLAARERLAHGGNDPGPLADALNDTAWFLTFAGDPAYRDPEAAVRLGERAVSLRPDRACYWNTLGAAYGRAGRPADAVRAVSRSAELGAGGNAADHYLLASAFARLGDAPEARRSFERGEALAGPIGPARPELSELRDEAAALCAPHEPPAPRTTA
jgi:tetratricopeptide (TPR) repeat protein